MNIPTDQISPQERCILHAALRAISPLTDADLDALPASRRHVLGRGDVLLRAGDHAQSSAFVISGGLREFYVLPDGTERTKSFNFPGGLAGSLSDLISGKASRVWVVAEVPSVLVSTPWPAYQRLVESVPAWGRFARQIAEQLYMTKVQREYELLALDAAERYRSAVAQWPMLEAIFSQRDIASYIGVTPVHLSRLRAAAAPASPETQNPLPR